MLVDIPDLNPKHDLLSEAEAKKVAKKYNITFDRFPKILETDPQVKALGAKPGDLVAIHREDPTGKYMYYRLVVEG